MVLKKLSLISAVGTLLLIQGLASQAVTFTLNVPSSVPSPASTFITGIRSDNNVYLASLTPSGTTTFVDQSNVNYGITQIGGGSPGSFDTFTSTTRPATFTFDVTANSVTNRFFVTGVIRDVAPGGTTISANGQSSGTGADFVAQSIRVNNSAIYTNIVNTPYQRAGVIANNIQFGSTFANIYVEQLNALTAPLSPDILSVNGYIEVVVPEPGSVALFVGMSAAGAGCLIRRKRSQKA